MSHNWIKTIDQLIVKNGDRRQKYYFADLTSREILEELGVVITGPNHDNVRRAVTMRYPDSKYESLGLQGWLLHIKVRTI